MSENENDSAGSNNDGSISEDIEYSSSSGDESSSEQPDETDYDSEPEGMYGNEPEYTAAELLLLGDSCSATDSEGDDDSDLDSSRLENMHWCSCLECSIMPTLHESKCCREFKMLLGDKLTDGMKCITKHPHFDDICLKKHILEASYIQLRRYKNNFKEIENMNNT